MFKSEYECLKAIQFYYEMFDYSGNPDWLQAAQEAEHSYIMDYC